MKVVYIDMDDTFKRVQLFVIPSPNTDSLPIFCPSKEQSKQLKA